jgi:excinuclease ABC subunit A
LKPAALSVRFAGLDIAEFAALPLDRMADVLAPAARGDFGTGGPEAAPRVTRAAARRDIEQRVAAGGSAHAGGQDVRRTPNLSEEKRVVARIETLRDLGLGYLSLDRSTPTLSAGELQRLRLGTQIQSNLFGVVYVLDEPSAGLHPADNESLLRSLKALQRSGNSVFVVEHDLAVMQAADWIVDVGPDAGQHGGQVLYSGPPNGLAQVGASHTARYLFQGLPLPAARRPVGKQWLALEGVHANNLRGVDVRFPLQALTCVSGVSGSGKSSLVTQALATLVRQHLGDEPSAEESHDPANDVLRPVAGRIVAGADRIRRLVQVDQKPIGRTPRSNLATYTGLFDPVRKLFADTPAARRHRYDAGRFSFNVAKGRCEVCEGEGFVSVELLFMPSVYAPCPSCHGARFDAATLEVTLRGRTIADVLSMTVDEAHRFFAGDTAVERPLALLADIGLGYLRLGQPATELSGGEAQRIKLATELQRAQRGDALYLLDEPTAGLHAADVDRLWVQLNRLVEAGNTVVLVEHDLRVVAACDWVLDMGPGGGSAGGQVVAAGRPADLAGAAASRTGGYLRSLLDEAA